ncbi:2-hydroxy-acid oxidase [Siccirubricoccus deserti]|uniref:FAD-binding protein n=1 Tax=Siccirubricoccus deserti TaxID=2013562 RepID=A0A9X0QUC5_9PROT|nr:FAD-binding protein [Siccirubricoccus deserti]MBC4013906.1 FAD-binding protein [Siccirubricoccus deserti]GGC30442.1 2-hydroxy-acid oxidase [Siccirubricoccus deserti]
MSASFLAPDTEAGVAAAVAAAAAEGVPLGIEGRGSKRGLLRPVQAARGLTLRNLSGITLYKPQELIIAAWAGTPLPEIEAALAEHGQHLIAEPPDLAALFGSAGPASLGGIVATNLSGPRRITGGATRDHVMGIRAVNGRGEVFRSGGRVLKNVTGLDLCKLLTGAHGTLGVLTEITLKVLPAPSATGTIAVRVADLADGVRVLSAGLGSPFGVTGAALLPQGGVGLGGPLAILRLEELPESVAYRSVRLRDELARFGEVALIGDAESRALWRAVRDAEPLGATAEQAVWRVSVQPSAGPGVVAATGFGQALLDWGGGLVWLAGPATAAAHANVIAAATAAGGSFTLFRAPEPLRAAVEVLSPEPPALAEIGRRVKAVMDPRGVLNPGRMRAGL